MDTTRVSRWHVHNRMTIPVGSMRADCMGGSVKVLEISIIQTGSVCHINRSKHYIQQLKSQVETCSTNKQCEEVRYQSLKLISAPIYIIL